MSYYSEDRIKSKIAVVVLSLGLLVWPIALIIGNVRSGYEYEREIHSYWSLADKSSTISAKAAYLDKFVVVLEQQGLSGQYNAILFPTPDNSFDLNLQALKTLQGRLHEIQQMNVTSFEYQTAIQQITAQEQGEAKVMLDVFEGAWYKQRHFLLWDWIQMTQWGVWILLGMAVSGLAGWAWDLF